MTTFVFVLMILSKGIWIPTIEFSTLDKCEKAAYAVEKFNDDNSTQFFKTRQKCLKIEK